MMIDRIKRASARLAAYGLERSNRDKGKRKAEAPYTGATGIRRADMKVAF